MFSRSILTGFLVAAAFSDAVIGASLSGRNKAELPSRGLAAAAPPHAQLEARAAASANWAAHFGGWGYLPGSFAQCQSTFQSHVDVTVALQSVNTLYTQVQDLCGQFSSFGGEIDVDERVTLEFRQHISQVFTSWQALLVTGRGIYGSDWISQFQPAFARFHILTQTLSTLCANLRVDLPGLLLGLNLDVNLFVGVGVNLGGLVGGGNFRK